MDDSQCVFLHFTHLAKDLMKLNYSKKIQQQKKRNIKTYKDSRRARRKQAHTEKKIT